MRHEISRVDNENNDFNEKSNNCNEIFDDFFDDTNGYYGYHNASDEDYVEDNGKMAMIMINKTMMKMTM